MAVYTSILKKETKTLIVSPDEEKSKEVIFEIKKILQLVGLSSYLENNRIEFQNGSTIEFTVPTEDGDVIRGKRSKLPMWLYEYERCDQDVIDEILKQFII